MKDPLVYIVQKLLSKNRIYFDKEELAFQIQSHPSYPSLHAATGVLDHFNIENISADVPKNVETLLQLPDCFIAQVKTEGSQPNLVLVDRKRLEYTIHQTSNKEEKLSEETFLERFTGIIMAVEKPKESQETKTNANPFGYIGFGLLILLASYLVFLRMTSPYNAAYFLLSFIGVVASITIVKQELGLRTAIGDAFCSGTDDKKDCDAVLTSKGAEIIKGYKLSDFSIIYFSGLTLLTFVQVTNPVLSFIISLLVIPVTIYSIYYQYAVVKKWCLLCLSIVGVLWIQALIPILTNHFIKEVFISDIVVLGIAFTAIWLLWGYAKPLIITLYELKKERIESVRFKRNFKLFSIVLNQSEIIDTAIENVTEITFGNEQSPLEIVIVTNPFCGHCKPVHHQIERILKVYSNDVRIVIRFNVGLNDSKSDAMEITSRLLEIHQKNGGQKCLEAMHDAYGELSPSKWFGKWGKSNEQELYLRVLQYENNWCTEKKINFTPEILIQGYSFPQEYDRGDLIYFIEELHEECNVDLKLQEAV